MGYVRHRITLLTVALVTAVTVNVPHTEGQHRLFERVDRQPRRSLDSSSCTPVQWNPAAVPGHCRVFDSVCVDHGSRIVTHDERYQIENVQRENTPNLPNIVWNLPLRVNTFPDALGGWQPDYAVSVRPVSKVEPTLPLRHPTWSNCTLPVILMVDYPYNYKTFVVKALTDVDSIFRVKGLAPNGDATLVLATPGGLALEPYHAVLLSPYSKRPLITLAELGRRGMEGQPTEWSGERIRVHCFSKLISCKLDQSDGTSGSVAASAVLAHLAATAPLPPDPLGFGGDGGGANGGAAGAVNDPGVLRVVVEARSAPWRSITNVQEILQACEKANKQGFTAGPFKRIVCKALPAAYDPGPAEPGNIPLDSPGVASLRSALGAVRSAHLFVALAGSSGAHAFFMQHPDNGAAAASGNGGGGVASGFLEIRPCGWGTEHSGRADGDQDALAQQLQRADDAIRFFAYNVENPGECSPPDYADHLRASLGNMKQQETGHDYQHRSPPRYTPEELLVRDQHVSLRPDPLLAMIRHAAALLGDKAAYQATRGSGRLHGYAVPEGVLLGPLALRDAPQRAKEGPLELIRA